jgi:hypothetical protein
MAIVELDEKTSVDLRKDKQIFYIVQKLPEKNQQVVPEYLWRAD